MLYWALVFLIIALVAAAFAKIHQKELAGAVDEGDRQYVGNEERCHCLKEGYRASGVLQYALRLLWLAAGAVDGIGCARGAILACLSKALALIDSVFQNSR